MTDKIGSRRAAVDADATKVQILERRQNLREDLQVIAQHDIDEAAREAGLKIANKYLAGQKYDLQRLTAEIQVQVGFITTAYVEIGRKLLSIKAAEGHGKFGKWLEENFPLSPRQARNFMKVALKLEREPELRPLARGGIAKALCLLDLPEDDLEEFKEEGTIYGNPVEDWQLKSSKELAADLEKERKSREKIIAEETKGLKAENEALVKQNKELQKFVPTDDPSPEWCLEKMAALSKAVRDAVALRRQFIYDERLKDDLPTQAKIESEFGWMRKELDELEREWIDVFTPEI